MSKVSELVRTVRQARPYTAQRTLARQIASVPRSKIVGHPLAGFGEFFNMRRVFRGVPLATIYGAIRRVDRGVLPRVSRGTTPAPSRRESSGSVC